MGQQTLCAVQFSVDKVVLTREVLQHMQAPKQPATELYLNLQEFGLMN